MGSTYDAQSSKHNSSSDTAVATEHIVMCRESVCFPAGLALNFFILNSKMWLTKEKSHRPAT
jgi:hypothetical protein